MNDGLSNDLDNLNLKLEVVETPHIELELNWLKLQTLKVPDHKVGSHLCLHIGHLVLFEMINICIVLSYVLPPCIPEVYRYGQNVTRDVR